jgi:hypothetical protein
MEEWKEQVPKASLNFQNRLQYTISSRPFNRTVSKRRLKPIVSQEGLKPTVSYPKEGRNAQFRFPKKDRMLSFVSQRRMESSVSFQNKDPTHSFISQRRIESSVSYPKEGSNPQFCPSVRITLISCLYWNFIALSERLQMLWSNLRCDLLFPKMQLRLSELIQEETKMYAVSVDRTRDLQIFSLTLSQLSYPRNVP